jgi:hypothetical protein
MGREIEISLETSQFDGGELVLDSKLENFFPFPRGAGQRREGDG